jgi:hypothetical protein
MVSLIITSLSAQDTTNMESKIEKVQPQSNLDLMLHYDQKLINTFFWSLAIILGFFSLNWLFNYRMSAREKDAIREELQAVFEKQFSELKTKIMEDSKTAIENSVKQSVANFNYRIKDLERENLDTQYELAQFEYKTGEMQKSSVGKLLSLLTMLNLSIKLNRHRQMADNLEAVHKILEDDKPILPDQLLDIQNTLSKLPDKFNTQREKISKAMMKVKTIQI